MWENFAEIPLEIIRQSTVNKTVSLYGLGTRNTFLFSHPKKSRKNHPEKLRIVRGNFLRPKRIRNFALEKSSIFTLKNYALLTEFHPDYPPSSGQTMPKMGLHRPKTLPYRTVPYWGTTTSAYVCCAAKLWKISGNPRHWSSIFTLEFSSFFHKEIAGKCILFFSGFFFSFLSIFFGRIEGLLQLTAIFCGRLQKSRVEINKR